MLVTKLLKWLIFVLADIHQVFYAWIQIVKNVGVESKT